MERKLTASNGRVIVKSRGVREEMECGLVIPKKFLKDSNVCTTDQGELVIILNNAGYETGDGRLIVREDEIIATIHGDSVAPRKGWILGRKCADPEDDSGLVALSDRQNQFVEVLAGGELYGVEDDSGWLAYVIEEGDPQKVEDSVDDWLIDATDIKFFYKGDEE